MKRETPHHVAASAPCPPPANLDRQKRGASARQASEYRGLDGRERRSEAVTFLAHRIVPDYWFGRGPAGHSVAFSWHFMPVQLAVEGANHRVRNGSHRRLGSLHGGQAAGTNDIAVMCWPCLKQGIQSSVSNLETSIRSVASSCCMSKRLETGGAMEVGEWG
jgi:hypothetical protein